MPGAGVCAVAFAGMEQGAHGVALGTLEADILDPDAARSLGEVGKQAAGQDQDHPGNRQ
jgi:hypothetical protein